MKLNKNFIGINYYLTDVIRQKVTDILMSPDVLKPALKIANWDLNDLSIRKNSLDLIQSNNKHKLYYITKQVQLHSELIKFDKVNLGWFRQVKQQSSTYILNKDEFFRFYVEEGKNIFILHFYREPKISDEDFKKIKKQNVPYGEFFGYRYDTFVIRFDKNEYPDGFMPENEIWGQSFENKKRFVKLLLFTELSEPEILEVKSGKKVKLDKNWENSMEGKVLNDLSVPVILVNTLWNKLIINTSGFAVHGHIRMQPYGQGRSLYKPVWIEEYQKSGYIRKYEKQ